MGYDTLGDSVNHNCLGAGFEPAWDEFNEFATVVLGDIMTEQSRLAAQTKMLVALRTITDAFFKAEDDEDNDASFIMMPIGERSSVGGLTKAERKAAKKLNKENKKQFFSRTRRAAGRRKKKKGKQNKQSPVDEKGFKTDFSCKARATLIGAINAIEGKLGKACPKFCNDNV